MAAYISIPRDLTRVKSEVLPNLTKRQLLCSEAGVLVGVPTFFLLKQSGSVLLVAIGMMIIMLPILFLRMYERYGRLLEVIAKQFIEAKFIHPEVRPYQINNYHTVLVWWAWAEQEVRRIVYPKKRKKTDRTQRNGSVGHSDRAGEEANSLCH